MKNKTKSFNEYIKYISMFIMRKLKYHNIFDNKSYVGFHCTDDENDKYFGSGKLLKFAIKKYGKENFYKSIIEYVQPDNWQKKEIFWIKELKTHISEGGYNLTYGGDGIIPAPNTGKIMSDITKQKIRNSLSLINSGENNPMFGKHHSCESIQKIKDNLDTKGDKNPMFEHVYTDDTLQLMSESQKNRTKIQCPICKKFFDPGNFGKWHGNKCKLQ
jgi:group I intron endonuclease